MKKLNKKELERIKELEEKAMDNFLEKADYYAGDWLDEKEAIELAELEERQYETRE